MCIRFCIATTIDEQINILKEEIKQFHVQKYSNATNPKNFLHMSLSFNGKDEKAKKKIDNFLVTLNFYLVEELYVNTIILYNDNLSKATSMNAYERLFEMHQANTNSEFKNINTGTHDLSIDKSKLSISVDRINQLEELMKNQEEVTKTLKFYFVCNYFTQEAAFNLVNELVVPSILKVDKTKDSSYMIISSEFSDISAKKAFLGYIDFECIHTASKYFLLFDLDYDEQHNINIDFKKLHMYQKKIKFIEHVIFTNFLGLRSDNADIFEYITCYFDFKIVKHDLRSEPVVFEKNTQHTFPLYTLSIKINTDLYEIFINCTNIISNDIETQNDNLFISIHLSMETTDYLKYFGRFFYDTDSLNSISEKRVLNNQLDKLPLDNDSTIKISDVFCFLKNIYKNPFLISNLNINCIPNIQDFDDFSYRCFYSLVYTRTYDVEHLYIKLKNFLSSLCKNKSYEQINFVEKLNNDTYAFDTSEGTMYFANYCRYICSISLYKINIDVLLERNLSNDICLYVTKKESSIYKRNVIAIKLRDSWDILINQVFKEKTNDQSQYSLFSKSSFIFIRTVMDTYLSSHKDRYNDITRFMLKQINSCVDFKFLNCLISCPLLVERFVEFVCIIHNILKSEHVSLIDSIIKKYNISEENIQAIWHRDYYSMTKMEGCVGELRHITNHYNIEVPDFSGVNKEAKTFFAIARNEITEKGNASKLKVSILTNDKDIHEIFTDINQNNLCLEDKTIGIQKVREKFKKILML
ncbi:hypothetical protein COBT_001748 [Conglomerata obtusa]